jgi:FtsP/CotA-like multicopper oxidase with cupredoxin domain
MPTATTSGGWLFHCHILEHSARGMMGFFEVYE